MQFSAQFIYFLKIAAGLFWIIAYLLIIYRGYKDRTFGMPIVALCANISWEFLFAFVHPHQPPQLYINIVWFGLDLFILYQVLYYGPGEMAHLFAKRWFYPLFFLSLCFSYLLILGLSRELQQWNGADTAFRQNFMMSIMFLFMLFSRPDLRGQSLTIAYLKSIGTVLPAIFFYIHYPKVMILNTLYIGIFIFDFLYIRLLHQRYKALGIKPWQRL